MNKSNEWLLLLKASAMQMSNLIFAVFGMFSQFSNFRMTRMCLTMNFLLRLGQQRIGFVDKHQRGRKGAGRAD
jgi:hypothetical protein